MANCYWRNDPAAGRHSSIVAFRCGEPNRQVGGKDFARFSQGMLAKLVYSGVSFSPGPPFAAPHKSTPSHRGGVLPSNRPSLVQPANGMPLDEARGSIEVDHVGDRR